MAEKEKLERLRAKRGGNRGAFTKKLKDEKTLLDGIKENQDIDDIQKGQLKVLRQFLEQKKKVLHEYEEQILDLCPVQEIDKEIEEADDIHAKINDVLNMITDKLSVSVTQKQVQHLTAMGTRFQAYNILKAQQLHQSCQS